MAAFSVRRGVNMKWPGLILTVLVISGCASSGHRSSAELYAPAPEVFHKWNEHQDYYALLEIVDAYIDPFNHKATKADVLKYLGQGCDSPEGYPNAGPKTWVYFSSRRVPYGAILIIDFDDHDVVTEIGWVSE
jgi:hypothetical protein